jgi:hypothetical protein
MGLVGMEIETGEGKLELYGVPVYRRGAYEKNMSEGREQPECR